MNKVVLKVDPIVRQPNGLSKLSMLENNTENHRADLAILHDAASRMGWLVDGQFVPEPESGLRTSFVMARGKRQLSFAQLNPQHRGLLDVLWFQSVEMGDISFATQLHDVGEQAPSTVIPYKYKINQFPGIGQILRSDFLLMQIQRMQEMFPVDFGICPRTVLFPTPQVDERAELADLWGSDPDKLEVLIVKPIAKHMGDAEITSNIVLQQSVREVMRILQNTRSQALDNYFHSGNQGPQASLSSQPMYLIQRLVTNPFLIDSKSFQVRCYALMLSCQPLTLLMHEEGVAWISE